MELEDSQGVEHTVFPAGSTTSDARWSSDSLCLAVVVSNNPRPVQSPDRIGVAEIWLVTVVDNEVSEPRLVLQPGPADETAGEWITLGAWSPEGSRLLFWVGPQGASSQADGLALWSLEVETGQATRLAEKTLVTPTYQSWAPDGGALAFTNGGYRSAQVGKWLSLYEVESGQIRSLIARSELIPGAVAWSPKGDRIAFAAVRGNQTGDEWADWMSWDNPVIQARRIYLLDPDSGQYQRLNAAEAYQDTPRWSADGEILYYVQIEGDLANLMAADPASGEAQPLPGCQIPRPPATGYYGQVDWSELYANCQMETRGSNRALAVCLLADFLAAQTFADYLTPQNLSAWSPDGHTLAYVSTTSHNTQLPVELHFTPGIPSNTLEVLATGCGLFGSILLDLY